MKQRDRRAVAETFSVQRELCGGIAGGEVHRSRKPHGMFRNINSLQARLLVAKTRVPQQVRSLVAPSRLASVASSRENRSYRLQQRS